MIRINKQSRKSKSSKFLHASSHSFWFNLSTLFFDNFMIFDSVDWMNWTDDANIGFPSCSGKSSPSLREGPRPAIFRLSGPPSHHCDVHYILYNPAYCAAYCWVHTYQHTNGSDSSSCRSNKKLNSQINVTSQEMRIHDWRIGRDFQSSILGIL